MCTKSNANDSNGNNSGSGDSKNKNHIEFNRCVNQDRKKTVFFQHIQFNIQALVHFCP